MDYRIEHDSMGEVKVPADKLWGAQTQRSCENFKIGVSIETMPKEIVTAFGILKKAAENIKNAKPLVYDKPIKFRVDLVERIPLPNLHNHPDVKIIDGRSYELEAETVEKALFRSL